MLREIKHIITDSETRYGILTVRIGDKTDELIKTLPSNFEMVVKGKKMKKRRKKGHINIWIGFSIMASFKPGYFATLKIKDDVLYLD